MTVHVQMFDLGHKVFACEHWHFPKVFSFVVICLSPARRAVRQEAILSFNGFFFVNYFLFISFVFERCISETTGDHFSKLSGKSCGGLV